MFQFIDYFLDRITTYRLVLYILIGLLIVAALLGLLGVVSISFLNIIFSSIFLVVVCWLSNKIFSWAFDAPTNIESAFITALILALIITPAQTFSDYLFLFWAGVLSMISKYILAINRKHIFNPAAIAVVVTSYVIHQSASWWIGTSWMASFVALSGFLIIRKLRYEDMTWVFFMTALITSFVISFMKGANLMSSFEQVIFHSSFIFLGSVMLTEPLTLPPTKNLQMIYGAIVGFLAVPQVNILGIYFAPELALCVGNIFAYLVSPKVKLLVQLVEKRQLSIDVYDFIFRPKQKFAYTPGQYMEWTLPHHNPDSRGNRRYFTLASSPTEDNIRLGVKFYPKGSTYKNALQQLDNASPIVGAQLAGNFTLPKDSQQKIVFIAGGIGVTPFRSMIKYLIDTKEHRDIILLYTNRTIDEIVYSDVFTQAQTELGIKTIYTVTDTTAIPNTWQGRVGRINAEMIIQEIPDYKERLFYLSGPYVMITAFEKALKEMGVPSTQIKKDFFPGLV